MNHPLLLPYYYKSEIEEFWQGLLVERLPALPEGVSINAVFTLLKEHTLNNSQYEIVHFLLGEAFLENYSKKGAIKYQHKQESLPKLLGKLRISLDKLIEVIELLNVLIDYGNTKGYWKFYLILKVEKIPHYKNPLGTDEDWQNLLYASQLMNHINQVGYQYISKFTEQEKLGLITLSLLFDSQVTNYSKLITLLKSVEDEHHYHYLQGCLFFWLVPDDYNPPEKVFIGYKTELLLYQVGIKARVPNNLQSHKQHASFISQAIRDYLKKQGIPYSSLPKSLLKWCTLAKLYHFMQAPPILVNYRSGINKSYALNTQATSRLFSITPSHLDVKYKTESSAAQPKRNSSYGLKQVQNIFSVKVKKQNAIAIKTSIENAANNLRYQLSPNLRLLLDWGVAMLEISKAKKFKVGPSQILNRIYTIGRHLVGFANQQDIAEMHASQRMVLFESVIDQAISTRNREAITYHLKAFNTWLESTQKLPPIPDKSSFFGHPKMTDLTVNANIIHFDEYDAIKKHLENLVNSDPFNDAYRMMLIALVLGFRCAMRSREIFQLKLDDYIYCDLSPLLAIRESAGRELKTANATRYLKLVDHMSEDEIGHLNHWYQEKAAQHLHQNKSASNIEQIQQGNIYFFSRHPHITNAININKIKAPLMKLIRHVCQDESLNFHHLRHSFASWHFLSACIAEFDLKIGSFFNHLPKTSAWLAQSKTRKLAHLPTQLKSKKYPFWIAKKMGHASFLTTFHHYVHFADLVIMLLQKSVKTTVTIKELVSVSNISESTLKKQTDRIEYAICKQVKPYKSLKQKRHLSLQQQPIWTTPDAEIALLHEPMREFSVYNMMDIFHLASEGRLSQEHAQHYGFAPQQTQQILDLFKSNPKYRLRRLFNDELSELYNLTNNLQKLYRFDLNSLEANPSFLALLNTFSNRLFPYSNDKQTLNIQKNYHLIFNDTTSGKILLDPLQALNIPFKLVLRHSKKWSNQKKTSCQSYWRKALGLPAKHSFKMKADSKKSIGQNGRLELLVLNTHQRKKHEYFYLLVMLSAWMEFKQWLS